MSKPSTPCACKAAGYPRQPTRATSPPSRTTRRKPSSRLSTGSARPSPPTHPPRAAFWRARLLPSSRPLKLAAAPLSIWPTRRAGRAARPVPPDVQRAAGPGRGAAALGGDCARRWPAVVPPSWRIAGFAGIRGWWERGGRVTVGASRPEQPKRTKEWVDKGGLGGCVVGG